MDGIALTPYLFFGGNCREAMEFYKNVFGGELTMKAYSDMPGTPEDAQDHIMHASLSGGAATFMASDSKIASPVSRKVELCFTGTDEAKLTEIFEALAAGGTVKTALRKEFWGDIFGALTDKFGVDWMFSISPKA